MTHRFTPFPTLPSERVGSLDVVRGVAVIGSIPLLMQSFSGHLMPITVPQELSVVNSVAGFIRLIEYTFLDLKILPLLSLVYGAGIILMCERIDGQDDALSNIPRTVGRLLAYFKLTTIFGQTSVAYVFRRTLSLFLLGAVVFFLFGGSMFVVALALAGFFAFLLRHRPAEQLGKVGLGWLVAGSISLILSGLWLDLSSSIYAEQTVAADGITLLPAAHFTWVQQIEFRLNHAFAESTVIPLAVTTIFHFGIMLIGMALAKSNFIAAQCPTKTYGLYALSGLMIGVPLAMISLIFGYRADWEVSSVLMVSAPLHFWASVCIVSAYISVIMIICRMSSLRWLKRYLAAVGRLALSNFVIAALLYAFFFANNALAVSIEFTLQQKVAAACGLALLSITASRLWSWYFCSGPVEWFLRALTYGVRTPFTTRRFAPA